MQQIKTVAITTQQKQKWIETRSALLWTCPAFTHILFSMLNPTGGELAAYFTEDVPIAATDGKNLILNPTTFFAHPLRARVFIVAHEIMHCILNHCVLAMPMERSKKVRYVDGKALPYDAKQMNMAMDFVINDALIEAKIGEMPKKPDGTQYGLADKAIGTQADSFLAVYRKIFDESKSGGGAGDGGFDIILPPGAAQGQDPGQAAQARSDAEWKTAVAAAISSAKAQGKLPASLERLLGELLEPEVSWQDHIRSFFSRKVGSGSYDWRKPDRRMISRRQDPIYTPARSGSGCGVVVVAIDTSGSIGQKELDRFFGEMRGILDDVRPQLVHLVWCDAKVNRVDDVEDSADLAGLKPAGGGGTDFRPVFDWIYQNDVKPEALVYLTDLLGSFPSEAPSYPVLWGDIFGRVTPPFGELVPVPLTKVA